MDGKNKVTRVEEALKNQNTKSTLNRTEKLKEIRSELKRKSVDDAPGRHTSKKTSATQSGSKSAVATAEKGKNIKREKWPKAIGEVKVK